MRFNQPHSPIFKLTVSLSFLNLYSEGRIIYCPLLRLPLQYGGRIIHLQILWQMSMHNSVTTLVCKKYLTWSTAKVIISKKISLQVRTNKALVSPSHRVSDVPKTSNSCNLLEICIFGLHSHAPKIDQRTKSVYE